MSAAPLITTRHLPDLGSALDEALVAWGSTTAFIDVDRRQELQQLTAREVRRDARRVCALLQAQGVQAGDRVGILLSNQPAWPISALGAFLAGAVLVPLDYKLDPPDLLALLEHCRPAVLLSEDAQLVRLERAGLGDALPPLLRVGRPADDPQSWHRAPAEPPRPQVRSREDIATIVYSSGTGGRPKGCMLSHGAYLAQAEVLAETFPIGPGKRFFSFLPTNHAIDFMCGFIVPLLSGATVIHQRTLRPEFLRWTMQRYRVTHMAAVPRLLSAFADGIRERLDALPDWQRLAVEALLDLNGALTEDRPRPALSRRLLVPFHAAFGGALELIVAGGAFVAPEDARLLQRVGIPVAIGYGLTEAGTVLTVNDLEPFRADTVGRPVRGVELRIAEADAEGVGEVVVRSPTLMTGYLDEAELTAETLVEGWLHTGDLGRLTEEGHLQLLGRRRNLIVTAGGKNVYPEDVEARFARCPGVAELALFSAAWVWPQVPASEDWLVLVARLEEGADPQAAAAALRERNESLVPWRRAATLVLHDSDFPRTASLKLRRGELAEELRAGAVPTRGSWE